MELPDTIHLPFEKITFVRVPQKKRKPELSIADINGFGEHKCLTTKTGLKEPSGSGGDTKTD